MPSGTTKKPLRCVRSPAGWTRTINQLLARRWKPSQGWNSHNVPLSPTSFPIPTTLVSSPRIAEIDDFPFNHKRVCGPRWLCDLSKYLTPRGSRITNVVDTLQVHACFLPPMIGLVRRHFYFHLCTWCEFLEEYFSRDLFCYSDHPA